MSVFRREELIVGLSPSINRGKIGGEPEIYPDLLLEGNLGIVWKVKEIILKV
jgi:hypothetical protein